MAQTQYTLNVNDYFDAGFAQVGAGAVATSTFFVAPAACKVSVVETTWGVAAGATSTLGIYKDTGTTAPGGGTLILANAIDANTTANTAAAQPLSLTAADYTLAQGDRLSIKVASGSATATANLKVNVFLNRV